MTKLGGFDYKSAGVDIEAGERIVADIREMVKKTHRREVLTGIGGFAGLFQPDVSRYREPVLVAATDGVGTKLKIAFAMGKHDTIGIDAVAMCVNDLVVQGAEPLFFLDYLATGRLDSQVVKEIISGVVEGCRQAGCALLGGETAEMPGFYPQGEYDLAGFSVGIVEKNRIISGEKVKPGDKLLGLVSSGLHSNGFSLVRKVLLEHAGLQLEDHVPELGCTLGEELLRPTRIYVPYVLSLLETFELKGIAHITGGGITNNLPRILPRGTRAVMAKKSWEISPIFGLVQRAGRIAEEEMLRTFNMGIGLILVVSQGDLGAVQEQLRGLKMEAHEVGRVESADVDSPHVAFQ